ncbi:MAG: hypothetical protein ACLTAF_23335, partial [Blautia coccoides]
NYRGNQENRKSAGIFGAYERLGHEGISVTYTYSHLYPSKQKFLADRLNEDRTTDKEEDEDKNRKEENQ